MDPILVAGNDKLTFSVVVCLLQAKHPVTLFTENRDSAIKSINTHLADLSQIPSQLARQAKLAVTDQLNQKLDYKLAVAVTSEDLSQKKALIQRLEKALTSEAVIAINTESIPLMDLQQGSRYPSRIIGVNWVEPAHTTYFLEIITNGQSNKDQTDYLFSLAKDWWNKDPYLVKNDVSIRAKMFAAMVREAFYLVQNGYASVEDIDRACRNDAGYYLPFAGNCRYMDLMGTYAYGMVMKDLNPELSKDRHLPEFFNNIIAAGGSGMENGKGFYEYEKEDAKRWDTLFRKFSYQIQEIISKYPFNYESKI